MPKNKNIKFLYYLARPSFSLAALALILAILVSILEVFSNILFLPLFQVLDKSQQISSQGISFISWIPKFYNNLPEKWILLAILVSLLTIVLIKNISLYLSSVAINNFTLKCGNNLRGKCVDRFLELELFFYNRVGPGELLGYVNEQAQRSEQFFSSILELIREIILTSCLVIFLVALSPVLAFITLTSLLLVILSLRLILTRVQQYGRRTAIALENFSSTVAEIISGIRVIKSFATEELETKLVRKSLSNRYEVELTAYKYNSAVAPLTETAGIIVLSIILLAGAYLFKSSEGKSLPILLTYTLTLVRTLPRVNHINSLRSNLSLWSGSYEAVYQFLDSTSNSSLPEGANPYSALRSALIFENVTFSYPESSRLVLQDVSLRIVKGKTTAIVGSSGSGKSTLVDLIMRFYDPNSGSIRVDNEDLHSIRRKSWHRAIAMVSQDTFLFNTTVRENIAYGRPDATMEEIMEATKKAYAYDFIRELPDRFHTVVGNRGARLSGGQRQRIAIARAILCDPDILILDEATSALDSNSERIVQKAIEEASRDRTVIVIAHRLSTIEKADNIVVMQEGAIAEQGTHQQLLAMEGLYYSLYRMQSLSSDEKSSSSVSY